ncbi:Malate-2H(+)/Na(+)-lactate antiporter [Caloramator mitchellensis]|uniref:Malate-2H(+)/Na(+)-lactate antiporter n=1 Tax=Caloramator mitchellensis TaxID=908809 RepID=A0A0R3JUX7_CALMK|nr:Na+/H+ antiporter NhaC [Caloramator mitchellensis]KRQ87387.1 Malate-2H(+)/Na(+)-lactate antiporter [Caloramator mitchellensis]
MEKGQSEIRQPKVWEALIPVIFLVAILSFSIIKYEASPHIPLIIASIVAALMALRVGLKWGDIEKGIIDTISMSMQAIIILMIIGTVIGAWILSGTVPAMIYYGLKILSPGIFLVATLIISSIVSLATGSSWTTAGTVGIALIGVGQGLGIPLPMVAGAVVSGAYFGDKMSPLSDTTNLAPAMAGATLFDHVRHMIFTTGPSYLIAMVVYAILGSRFAGRELDVAQINKILEALGQQFNISIWLLIPPIVVIIMVVKKVPAIPGLLSGTVLGAIFALIFQGKGFGDILSVLNDGYVSETGFQIVDDLLTRGGMQSMMYTVSLILCAMTFGGIMEKAGFLEKLAQMLLSASDSVGALVSATIFSSIFTNIVAGDQYLSIVIPGRMFKSAFEKKGLAPKNLSRCLEDAGTLTSPLIPWNTCGAFMMGALGVHPFAYLPFAVLNYVNPLVSMFYGFTGITMEKIKPEQANTVKA